MSHCTCCCFAERLSVSHDSTSQSIFNNTVINRFMTLASKREANEDYVYEAPELFSNDGQHLTVICSGVQGDHDVRWLTDNERVGDSDSVVNCDGRPNSQQLLSNYSSRLARCFPHTCFIHTCSSQASTK